MDNGKITKFKDRVTIFGVTGRGMKENGRIIYFMGKGNILLLMEIFINGSSIKEFEKEKVFHIIIMEMFSSVLEKMVESQAEEFSIKKMEQHKKAYGKIINFMALVFLQLLME